MAKDLNALTKFLLEESSLSGDYFMQAANVVKQYQVQKEVVNSLRAEAEAADHQMKMLAAENQHLMNMLVQIQRDSFVERIPAGAKLSDKCQLNHQLIMAEQGFRASMPATNKILDVVRMEYLAELSRMTCPVSGKVFDKNAQATFCELMVSLKGGDDD